MDEELEEITMLPGDSPLNSSFEESSTTDDLNKPIFEVSQITLATSILLTMTLALKYFLSGVAIADLTLISLHCSVPSLCKPSFTTFQRLFHDLSAPISMHKYCSHCLMLVEDDSLVNCPNTLCSKSLQEFGSKSYFLTMNINLQLQKLFQTPGFIDDLRHCFKRKSNKGTIKDIYDGQQYQKLFPNGSLGTG